MSWLLIKYPQEKVNILSNDGNGNLVLEIKKPFNWFIFIILVIFWVIPGIIYLIYYLISSNERVKVKLYAKTGEVLEVSKYSTKLKTKYNSMLNQGGNNLDLQKNVNNRKSIISSREKKLIILMLLLTIGMAIIISINNPQIEKQTQNKNESRLNEILEKVGQVEISTNEKIIVVKKMVEENKKGFLACRTIVLNYKTKQQSEKQWQEFADSWEINVNQAKYLVEKCEGVNSLGAEFLPGLLENLNNGVVK